MCLLVRGPKLNTDLELQLNQSQVQRDSHLPSPSDYTISDTSWDAIGLLGYLGLLLAHVQAANVLLCLQSRYYWLLLAVCGVQPFIIIIILFFNHRELFSVVVCL